MDLTLRPSPLRTASPIRTFGLVLMSISTAVALAGGCKGTSESTDEAAASGTVARPSGLPASCAAVPECVPPKAPAPNDDRRCWVGEVAVTCPYCGPDGGLYECLDIKRDGCPTLVRRECGRPNGCEFHAAPAASAACARLPGEATGQQGPVNQFGAIAPDQPFPASFVAAHKSKAFPVAKGRLTLAVRTRDFLVGESTWRVVVKGGGLDIDSDVMRTEYADVNDDYALLRKEFDVSAYDGTSGSVTVEYTIADYRGDTKVVYSEITLVPASGP